MAEEIAFENGRIFNFQGLVTLTLTLDRVILHIVVHHSLISTHMPNFFKIKEIFVDGRTYVRMDRRTSEIGFITSTLPDSRPKNPPSNDDNTEACKWKLFIRDYHIAGQLVKVVAIRLDVLWVGSRLQAVNGKWHYAVRQNIMQITQMRVTPAISHMCV